MPASPTTFPATTPCRMPMGRKRVGFPTWETRRATCWWRPGTRSRISAWASATWVWMSFENPIPIFGWPPFSRTGRTFSGNRKLRSGYPPGLARCKAGRLGHVEPNDGSGEFTTHPLVQEGNRLLINARIENRGSVQVEVQDADRNVFRGLELDGSVFLSGASVARPVRWKGPACRKCTEQWFGCGSFWTGPASTISF